MREKKIIKKLPVDKETAGVIGSVALSASQGYIDTKVIKHINIKIVGGDMYDVIVVKSNKGITQINHSALELVKGKVKVKPEDLTRYMVFGTGCENLGDIRHTEKELREDVKEKHRKNIN